MQHEEIILEMLAHIQALEDQVAQLQKALADTPSTAPTVQTVPPIPPTPHRTNSKVTDKMLEACYRAGKKAHESDEYDVRQLADEVHKKTGMNFSNAVMTIFAVIALLNGELYKRAISAKAIEKYFNRITEDYGNGGLHKAIGAIRLHITYRRKFHHNVDCLERLCDAYQAK